MADRSSKGGLFGCLAGVVFTCIVAFPFLFVLAWSGAHCEPVPQCQRDGERAFAVQMAVIVGLAALLASGVRAIVNWWMTRRIGGSTKTHPPLWALLSVSILLLGAFFFIASSGSLLP